MAKNETDKAEAGDTTSKKRVKETFPKHLSSQVEGI